MTNENCLKGMQCPECASDGPFNIESRVVVKVFDDGTEIASENVEWDEHAYCMCDLCGHAATVGDFTEKPESEPPEWGWYEKGGEYAHGPFPTEEAASADAREYFEDETVEIGVGTISYPDPASYIPTDLDDLLAQMNESACDDLFSFWGESVFDMKTEQREDAQAKLTEALSRWAEKWITPAQCVGRGRR